MVVMGVLLMSGLSSFANIATFTVYPSNQCEKGALQYTRSGNFGMCFYPSGHFHLPTEVNYWGNHYIEIRDQSNGVVYSNSSSFNTTADVNIVDGGFCAYKSFAATLPSGQMSNIVQNLDPGTYYVYIWSSYFWWYFAGGIISSGNNTEGSSSWPNHQGSVTITEEHLTHPIDIEKVKMGTREANPYYLNNCDATTSIDFYVENVSPLIGNLYSVTAEWAEVTSCNNNPVNFSDPRVSSLFILFPNYPEDQILRLGNIRSSAVLQDNPFIGNSNVGKRYKLRFTLDNGRCDPVVVEMCVLFGDIPQVNDVTVLQCSDPSYVECVGGFQSTSLSGPCPLVGYNTALIQFEGNGGIDKVLYYLKSGNNCSTGVYNISPNQLLNNNTITINMNVFGIDFENEGNNSYELELLLINSCTKCYKYNSKTKMMELDEDCSFTGTISSEDESRLDCRLFDNLGEVSNESNVYTVSGGGVIGACFAINENISFRPISDGSAIIESNYGELTLYPNPFGNELIINNPFEHSEAVLLNLEGRVVKSFSLHPFQKNTINTSDLSSGMYILQHKASDAIRSYRVVKF